MRYALVDDKGTINRFAADIDPGVATRHPWRWLPVQEETPPAVSESQAIDASTYAVVAGRVVKTYTVRDKSAKELEEEKDMQVAGLGAVVLRVLWNHENRVRALEGLQPVTPQQFRSTLKALI